MESFVKSSLMNKLRNTISSTAAATATTIGNAVLPGNAVTRDYEVLQHVCSAGPHLMWKVYSGFKKSTKAEASVFVMEKRQLDDGRFKSRSERDQVLDLLRRGVSQLTRLRHPSLLVVEHPLEESRDSLAFATEPVATSLANLTGDRRNAPPLAQDEDTGDLFEMEIKYGLLSLAQGLAFVHNDAKILHRNLCPESVLVSKRGSWKLFGFDFAASAVDAAAVPLHFPVLRPVVALMSPNADYAAPECLAAGEASDSLPPATVTLAADMYSMAVLTAALYNKGRPVTRDGGSGAGLADCIMDEETRRQVQQLLHPDPDMRPDAHRFTSFSMFEDVLIRTLQFLDSLFHWDSVEKCKFYRGLPELLGRMPLRVRLHRVLPCLSRDLSCPDMVPFVLVS